MSSTTAVMPQDVPIKLPCITDGQVKDNRPKTELDMPGFYEARGVHPFHKPAVPSHDAMKASPHHPVFVTPNPMVEHQVFDGSSDVAQQLKINDGPMAIDSPIFSGKIEVHLKGLSSTKKGFFDGKKRFFHVMVQGKFKRPVQAGALCMGQEFLKAGHVPQWIGEMVLTAAAKTFSNSTKVSVQSPLPYFMNPALAACQLVNVSKEGEEPAMKEATEDMRLFSSELADKKGNAMAAEKRRRWCDVTKNLEGKTFDTEYVWTFHIWQHLIDFSTYRLSVGGFVGLDLAPALDGQPLQLTVKDTQADEYAFSMLVWHEQLLYAEDSDTAAAMLTSRINRWTSGFKSMLSWSK